MKTNSSSASRKQGDQHQNRITRYFRELLLPDGLLETELMLLALAAGINDATTFPDYHVFASNQTGNTALLAVGALGLAGNTVDLKNVGFSLGLFILGSVLFGQLGHRLGRTRRSWLLCTNTLQTLFVLVAAALRKWIPTDINDTPRYAVIALLSFASGGQVAMARTVDVPEVTTAMVTSAYVDFVVDPQLFARKNRPRNRRGIFVLVLILGSFIGAVAYREVEPACALLLAGLVKFGVCILLFFNHQQSVEADEEQSRQIFPEISRQHSDHEHI